MSQTYEIKLDPNALRTNESVGGASQAGEFMAGDFKPGPRIIIMPLVGGAGQMVVEQGNTIGFEARFLDENGDVFSPVGDAATISIIDPANTTVVDATSMTPRGVGKFLYEYQTASTQLKGTWRVFVRGQITSGNYIQNTLRYLLAVVK